MGACRKKPAQPASGTLNWMTPSETLLRLCLGGFGKIFAKQRLLLAFVRFHGPIFETEKPFENVCTTRGLPCSVRRELRLQNLGFHRDTQLKLEQKLLPATQATNSKSRERCATLLLPSCVLSPSHDDQQGEAVADTSLHGWNHQNYYQKPCHQGQRSRRLLSDSDQKIPSQSGFRCFLGCSCSLSNLLLSFVASLLFKIHSPQHCRNKLIWFPLVCPRFLFLETLCCFCLEQTFGMNLEHVCCMFWHGDMFMFVL